MRRHELSDEQWALEGQEDVLPPVAQAMPLFNRLIQPIRLRTKRVGREAFLESAAARGGCEPGYCQEQ